MRLNLGCLRLTCDFAWISLVVLNVYCVLFLYKLMFSNTFLIKILNFTKSPILSCHLQGTCHKAMFVGPIICFPSFYVNRISLCRFLIAWLYIRVMPRNTWVFGYCSRVARSICVPRMLSCLELYI